MKIADFLKGYKVSSRDKRVALKVFDGQDKTEKEWLQEVNGKISIKKIVKPKKTSSKPKKTSEKSSTKDKK